MNKLTLDSEVIVTWYDQGLDEDCQGSSGQCLTVRELYNYYLKGDRNFEGNYEPVYNDGDVDANGDMDDDKFVAGLARGLEAYEQGINGDIVKYIIEYFLNADIGYIMSMEEHSKREKEKDLVKMDRLASKYAKIWGCTAGSYNFVKLIKGAIKDLDDRYEQDMGYECKAERWAACQYAGVTESFWPDEDFIKGRYANAYDELSMVLNWLELNCPLLMACIQEEELAEK